MVVSYVEVGEWIQTMRRSIIILAVLLFAGSAYGADPFQVEYICIADPSRPAEAEFCALFQIQLFASGMFEFDIDKSRSHFQIIILPTVRDGYYSVTVASNFIYPPLAGLALSAYLSSYIIAPIQGEDLVRCVDYMVQKVIVGTSEWWLWFEGKIGPSSGSLPLEVRND